MTAITTSGTWTGLEVVSAGSGEQKQAATANVRPRITVGTRSIRSRGREDPIPASVPRRRPNGVLPSQNSRPTPPRKTIQATERKARKDSAGHRARARGDQPKILMDAARGRAEASGGAGARLRDARREAAGEALSAAREKIEILQPLRMDIPRPALPPAGKSCGWIE